MAQGGTGSRLDRAERHVRKSAISLCDMPLQYASSMSVRSCSGMTSSARWTRHDSHSASAASAGPGSGATSSGASSTAGSGRRRSPSMIALRATVKIHDVARPSRGVEAVGCAPHARERVLGHVLGRPAIADPPQRDAEHRARVAAVELLERRPVAAGDQSDQLGVGPRVCGHGRDARDSRVQGQTDSERDRRIHTRSTFARARRIHALAPRWGGPRPPPPSCDESRHQLERAASSFAATAFQSTTFHQAAR